MAWDETQNPKIKIEHLDFYYGRVQALFDVSLNITCNEVTALIGPSGCGKSTFLRTLNRMNDIILGAYVEGKVLVDEQDIYARNADVFTLRKWIGMVFQKSNPFPKSIFDNVVFGPRVHGVKDRRILEEICERSLIRAALWDEIKDRLNQSAMDLSGEQQQRLCIARALVLCERNPAITLSNSRDDLAGFPYTVWSPRHSVCRHSYHETTDRFGTCS